MSHDLQHSLGGPIRFNSWGGEHGIDNFIQQKTGCKPFSGAGINYRVAKSAAILKSVRGTPYYADNLSDYDNPKYTLYGQYGDQDIHEKRFNEPLMNPNKTKHIYLYELYKKGNKTEYLWFGEYSIDSHENVQHTDKNGIPRTIIVLSLKKKL